MAAAAEKPFLDRPKADPSVKYPLKVLYCGECSLPLEYCEYYPNGDRCRQWLEKHLPGEFERLYAGDDTAAAPAAGEDAGGDADKKRQTRGGKGLVKVKLASSAAVATEEKQIRLYRQSRGKKKHSTLVTGFALFGVDVKAAAKVLGQKFACGASGDVAGDAITVQGDIKDDLFDFIPEKWSQIDEDQIEDMGDSKR